MDSLNRYVVKLQATSGATDETVQKMHGQLSSLFDGHGVTRSQIRMLEQQMSRMESLAKQQGAGRQAGGAPCAAVGGGSQGIPSPADMFRLQQDIYALKQSVAYLYNQHQQQQGYTSAAGGGATAAVGRGQQQHTSADPASNGLVAPLRADALRPPYVPSNRSTPTKGASVGGGVGGGAGSHRYSGLESPTIRSPNSKQFVTVLDDSEDEYESSKLANSALD
jgi:hypothetical protein